MKDPKKTERIENKKYEIIALDAYADWLADIKNKTDALRISSRVLRIEQGNFGDWKSVGNGVHELRFTFGPGYRVYYTLREGTACLLLGGGTKNKQQKTYNQPTIWRTAFSGSHLVNSIPCNRETTHDLYT